MESRTPFQLISALAMQLNGMLSHIDIDDLPAPDRKVLAPIRQQAIDARLEVRDYDLAQTRVEQLELAGEGKERLEQLHQSILAASNLGVFGPADVAHLSAQIQQIISLLA